MSLFQSFSSRVSSTIPDRAWRLRRGGSGRKLQAPLFRVAKAGRPIPSRDPGRGVTL